MNRLLDSTNNSCTLKSILYPKDLSGNANIIRGINLEPKAKEKYSLLYGKDVVNCGLFVSLENGILAASPDGLLGDDGILEVKCTKVEPQALPFRKSTFLEFTEDPKPQMRLKRRHMYYYQIIQQLYVTGRSYCDFFVYFESEDAAESHVFRETITRDADSDTLWDLMKEKLIKFYKEDMAGEIVDPTLPKKLPFRQPIYRQQAIAARVARNNSKSKPKKK